MRLARLHVRDERGDVLVDPPARDDLTHITIRHPDVSDGARIWEFVRSTKVLEPNTCYAYLLLATHFSRTCLVAEVEERIVGFVAAYRLPQRPEVIFVWQIGVGLEVRGRGLGKRLLRHLIGVDACGDVTHLEATVTPSNEPSTRLFEGFARDLQVSCTRSRGFVAADFGPLDHEAEELFRIGPLPRIR